MVTNLDLCFSEILLKVSDIGEVVFAITVSKEEKKTVKFTIIIRLEIRKDLSYQY